VWALPFHSVPGPKRQTQSLGTPTSPASRICSRLQLAAALFGGTGKGSFGPAGITGVPAGQLRSSFMRLQSDAPFGARGERA